MKTTLVNDIRYIEPDNDNWLYKDGIFSKGVYLGEQAIASDWLEVSSSYRDAMVSDIVYSTPSLIKLIDTSAGDQDYYLIDPRGRKGIEVYVQKVDADESHIVKIHTVAGSIIGNVTTLTGQYNHVTYISDGNNWYVKENN